MNHERYVLRQRTRRKFRVRGRVRGSGERPRMSVFRSHKHIYAQLIDDNLGKTLVAASSLDHELREAIRYGGNRAAAERIGQTLAERAIAAGIHKVAFDRGPYRYHGRVAAVAEGARKGGLEL